MVPVRAGQQDRDENPGVEMVLPQCPTIVAAVDDSNNRHTLVPEQPRANNQGSSTVARRANDQEVGQEVRQTLRRLNYLLDRVLDVRSTKKDQVGTVQESLEEAVPSDNLESQDELRQVMESLDVESPPTEEMIARTVMGQERGVCFVTCEANSIAFDALVDTGAAKSLMTPKLAAVLQAQVTPADTRLASVTGARIPTEGTAFLQFECDGSLVEHEFVVAAGITEDCILGQDFMVSNQATIAFVKDAAHITVGTALDVSVDRRNNRRGTAIDMVNVVETVETAGTVCQIGELRPLVLQTTGTTADKEEALAPGCPEPRASVESSNGPDDMKSKDMATTPATAQATSSVADSATPSAGTLTDFEQRRALLDSTLAKSTNLTGEQLVTFGNMIAEYHDVLMGKSLGCAKGVTFAIELTEGTTPVKQPLRRYSVAMNKTIQEHVEKMLREGWIRESNSAWSSSPLLIPKPDGTMRFCIDYRILNDHTVTDAFPSPIAEDIMDQMHGMEFFTTMDAEKGYYQVPMDDKSAKCTAFACNSGLYEFTRMPFGLKNAGACFQRMMNTVLQPLIVEGACRVFVDDIIIFSKTFQDHVRHVERALQLLRKAGITTRFDKCVFARDEVKFLGFILSKLGRRIDPAKLDAMAKILAPKTKRQLRQFLGMASYLRIFVKDLSKIARPLTELTKMEVGCKDVGHRWTGEHQQAFDTIKKALVSSSTLAHPMLAEPFTIETDASDHAIGAMLAQYHYPEGKARVLRPVAYASAKLSDAQCRYSATDREGLAVVWALDKFRHYLTPGQVQIITDHAALTGLMRSQLKSARLQHWAARI